MAKNNTTNVNSENVDKMQVALEKLFVQAAEASADLKEGRELLRAAKKMILEIKKQEKTGAANNEI